MLHQDEGFRRHVYYTCKVVGPTGEVGGDGADDGGEWERGDRLGALRKEEELIIPEGSRRGVGGRRLDRGPLLDGRGRLGEGGGEGGGGGGGGDGDGTAGGGEGEGEGEESGHRR